MYRLPIRVELGALSADDFKRILVEPDSSLTEQYQGLLGTEGVNVKFTFTDDGIQRIAETAAVFVYKLFLLAKIL